jgi:hypothetical protein
MKKLFLTCSLIALLGSFVSCDNADYPSLDNSLYIAEAYNAVEKQVIINEDGGAATFSVRTAQPVGEQLRVEIGADKGALEWYESRHNENKYEMLDPSEYSLSQTTLTIEPGKTASDQVKVDIKPSVLSKLDGDTKYAIAFTVKSVSPSGIFVLQSLKNYILICSK